jgi:steroid 5-alpha reductase family enzyme
MRRIQTGRLAEWSLMNPVPTACRTFEMIYLAGLLIATLAAFCTWLASLLQRNVAIVDSLWSLMFVMMAIVYAACYASGAGTLGTRAILALVLVGVWAARLSIYITVRNWGHGEDRRYQAIRARNQPHFGLKSLYLVFGLQALLAWIISVPLLGAILSSRPLGAIDAAGVGLWVLGVAFEAGGDWQLARFKADPANRGQVMDRGFWRYTRHPNYFGDFCVWWGFYLLAASAGAWWSIVGPLLMSVLLMKVSGVTLLERDIGERRPAYADYTRRTNAFFPGMPKAP